MRLLFDENLSEQLVRLLADIFPNALHVRILGCGGASDVAVWELARQHNCTLVTRDEDFLQMSTLRRGPPKVIWLSGGNGPNTEVADLLRRSFSAIQRFVEYEEATFLVLQ